MRSSAPRRGHQRTRCAQPVPEPVGTTRRSKSARAVPASAALGCPRCQDPNRTPPPGWYLRSLRAGRPPAQDGPTARKAARPPQQTAVKASAITLGAAAGPFFQGCAYPRLRTATSPHHRQQGLRHLRQDSHPGNTHQPPPAARHPLPLQLQACLPVGETAPAVQRSPVPYSEQASGLEPPYGIEP
jgi:hypothetical protein